MGSSGTGSFTDYSDNPPSKGGGGGGASGDDICLHSFESDVEEVGTCEYWRTHGNVPGKGTDVRVVKRGRPSVIDADGTLIGYLPTKFNYLISCIISGHAYAGTVTQSSNKPLPTVFVSVSPVAK